MTALHFWVPFRTTGCSKGWCRRGNLQMHCCHKGVRDFSNFPLKRLRLLFCWFIQLFALAVLPQSHWIYVAIKQLHVALCVCSSVSVVLSFIKHWTHKCGNSCSAGINHSNSCYQELNLFTLAKNCGISDLLMLPATSLIYWPSRIGRLCLAKVYFMP